MPWPKGRPHTPEMIAKAVLTRTTNGVRRKVPLLSECGEEMWTCSKCGAVLPASGFYSSKKAVNGLTSHCRRCHCKTSMATRDYNKVRDARRKSGRKLRAKYPEKYAARERGRIRIKDNRTLCRAQCNNAVRTGRLIKPATCSRCGRSDLRIEAHHVDYSKPLEVQWLCSECHGLTFRRVEVEDARR